MISMKRNIRVPVYAAISAVVIYVLVKSLLFYFSAPVDDREFLLRLVDNIAAAAEKRDINEIRKWISRQYQDAKGRDYPQINQLLVLHFLRQGTISIYVVDREVELSGDKKPPEAMLRAKVVLARGPKVARLVDVVPEAADAYEFVLYLRKDDHWRLHSSDWMPIQNVQQLLF